jgi:hypothetical protein
LKYEEPKKIIRFILKNTNLKKKKQTIANSGSSSGLIPKAKALAEYPFGKPDPSSL